MRSHEMTFEEEVIDRLARMETRLETLPILVSKVDKLEAHRNAMAGAIALLTSIGGYLFHLKT